MNRLPQMPGFAQEIFHALVQQAAGRLKPVYLLLLTANDLIERLQQIILVCNLDFKLDNAIFIHFVTFWLNDF